MCSSCRRDSIYGRRAGWDHHLEEVSLAVAGDGVGHCRSSSMVAVVRVLAGTGDARVEVQVGREDEGFDADEDDRDGGV